jgi:hypothetical protein
MIIGDKIKFEGERQRYTVQAFDERFIIATKPFNMKKTYLYTIIDLEREVRGPDDRLFGALNSYNNPRGAAKNLLLLNNNEMCVSYRHYKALSPAEFEMIKAMY